MKVQKPSRVCEITHDAHGELLAIAEDAHGQRVTVASVNRFVRLLADWARRCVPVANTRVAYIPTENDFSVYDDTTGEPLVFKAVDRPRTWLN